VVVYLCAVVILLCIMANYKGWNKIVYKRARQRSDRPRRAALRSIQPSWLRGRVDTDEVNKLRFMKRKFKQGTRGLRRAAFVKNYRNKHDSLAMRAYESYFGTRPRLSVVRRYPN